jgi:hypothetical protein
MRKFRKRNTEIVNSLTTDRCLDHDDQKSCPLCNPPLLHSWDGGKSWNTGGMNTADARWLHSISDSKSGSVVETGAGLSTLIFGMTSTNVVSVVVEEDLLQRIRTSIKDYELLFEWQSHCGLSEMFLPSVDIQAGLCLIDGGHGFPTPYVDFYFMNRILVNGGMLIIDDIQLPAPRELVLNLIESRYFYKLESFSPSGKTVALRKSTNSVQLPDFGGMGRDVANTLDIDSARQIIESSLKSIS